MIEMKSFPVARQTRNRMSLLISLLLALCFELTSYFQVNASIANGRPITLYTNEFARPGIEMSSAERTVTTIRNAIAPRKLITKTVTINELHDAMRHNTADIFIAGPGVYWLHLNEGLRDIATLVTEEQPDPDHAGGALILAREDDNGISSIADLKGKRLGTNHPLGFEAYLTILKEIEDLGYDSENFFGKINFYGPNRSKRFEALRSNEVDAIAINVCYAEREMAKGNDVLKGLKVVGERSPNESRCRASTSLYPNWTFVISPNLDAQTIVKIAKSLYAMDEKPDGQYWTIASDYRSADALYKTLKVGPYSYLREWTIERIWNQYGLLIVALFLSLTFFMWHHFQVRKLVDKRTKELKQSLFRQKKLFQNLQEVTRKLESTQKAVMVSQLSNLVVHDLSQPLSTISFYAKGLKLLLNRKIGKEENQIDEVATSISRQAEKASQIIQKVRNYASNKSELFQPVNLRGVLEKTIQNLVGSGRLNPAEIRLTSPADKLYVSGSPLELELMFTNIIKNSFEASKDEPLSIEITLSKVANKKVEIAITDNGSPLPVEEFNKILEPLQSDKAEGLGLGLSIVQSIVERHLGSINLNQNKEKGITVRIVLPLMPCKS